MGVQVHFKGNNTVSNLLVAPKNRDSILTKEVSVWPCRMYNGIHRELVWILGIGKVTLKAPSPIFDHSQTTGHSIRLDNFSIVDRDSQGIIRTIKEAMYIRVNNSSLNRNLGKCKLAHIFDGYYRICQLSIYSDPCFHPSTVHYRPPQLRGTHLLWISVFLPGLPPFPSFPTFLYFSTIFSHYILAPNW